MTAGGRRSDQIDGPMMINAFALAYALVSCLPTDTAGLHPIVDPSSMARIVAVESHGNPFALHDNATDVEYEPASKAEALQIFRSLKDDSDRRCAIARDRGRYCLIDVGLAQVDEVNFDVRNVELMLDPCANLRVAAPLMLSAWQTAVRHAAQPSTWQRYVALYGPRRRPEQVVLRAAYSIYNSNSAFGNPAYVARIEQAGQDPYVIEATRYADRLWLARRPAAVTVSDRGR